MATTALDTAPSVAVRAPRGRLRPGWPLTALYALFPVWWLLGLSHFVFLILAVPMAWQLLRRRPVFTTTGFGLWLLFLLVVAAGGSLLWVVPPGTVPPRGAAALITFTYRFAWYVAITVVALYVLNVREEELPTEKVMRLLGLMFVYTTIGGLAGLLFPLADFRSALEYVVHVPDNSFINSLIHPSLATVSEFLGYEQPRPSAPFAYSNAWGNNLGLFLPFFVGSWLRRGSGWRRLVGAPVLVAAFIPIAYSLDRGLWIGLLATLVLVSLRLGFLGRTRLLQATAGFVIVGTVVFLATPLYDTVIIRAQTPHSNERRGALAQAAVTKTLELSPVVGYGDTRSLTGSFVSIAGGGTPDCPLCADPPLGTQGFIWRLIFTTGLLGSALFLAYVFGQLFRFFREQDPVALICCTVISLALFFSLVYDSLESPLFTMMIAIALLNRRFLRAGQVARSSLARPQ